MGYIVTVPTGGMGMNEGTFLRWAVDVGDTVTEGDTIAEAEFEKSTIEITAKEDGVLRRAYVQRGDTIEARSSLGVVASKDESIDSVEAAAAGNSEPSQRDPTNSAVSDGAPPSRASPKARRRAAKHGIELAEVDGTGPEGAVTDSDVKRALELESTNGVDEPQIEEATELSEMRRTIADRLGQSKREAVQVTVHRSIPMDDAITVQEAVADDIEADISVIDVVIVALSAALSKHSSLNATFVDGVHRTHSHQNIGVAIDVDGGLRTPVIPRVEHRSIDEIADIRQEVTRLVRHREYRQQDWARGTFTVTNLGPFEVDSFTPIINPPQVAILGVNRIRERAVTASSGIEMVPHATFDLTFDHRVIDGADAARFLSALASSLSDQDTLTRDFD